MIRLPVGWTILVPVLLIGGCHATTPERQGQSHISMLKRYSSAKEGLCVHCNCVMPAGIDPESICPVCKCGKKALECVH